MKIGTRSLLFGAHQVLIHPVFVAIGWWKLYGFPKDYRIWIAFVIHDWGYWGKPNMDGPEGELHPLWAAEVMRFFGEDWYEFCLYHSRFIAIKEGADYSKLCVADKLATGLTPAWIYLPLTMLSGELSEYMQGKGERTPANGRSPKQWFSDVRCFLTAWAYAHKDNEDRKRRDVKTKTLNCSLKRG